MAQGHGQAVSVRAGLSSFLKMLNFSPPSSVALVSEKDKVFSSEKALKSYPAYVGGYFVVVSDWFSCSAFR
jgi:hypothetical protein